MDSEKAGQSLVDLEEDLFSLVLRYALYFGAIFQMVCIGACIFLAPTSPDCGILGKDETNEEHITSSQNAPRRPQHRNRKPEKKKRR